jgi:hypothetical protein
MWEQSASRTIPKRRAAPRHLSSPQQGVIAEFHRIRVEIRRVIAERDLVAAHNLITTSSEDRGIAGQILSGGGTPTLSNTGTSDKRSPRALGQRQHDVLT